MTEHHITAEPTFRGNWSGYYATQVYLPLCLVAERLRSLSRRWRGKLDKEAHPTRLPKVPWQSLVPRRPIWLCEPAKADGNVRLSELGILCQLARGLRDPGLIFEIGTFDGRTTLNLALNRRDHPIITLDLPADHPTRYQVETGEERFIRKSASGTHFLNKREIFPQACGRIHQVFGDSATFNFAPYSGRCSLVFVDGSHAYAYAQKDSETALQLVHRTGSIVWHDYGVWTGVTRALEELNDAQNLNLQHIHGTSLVVFGFK